MKYRANHPPPAHWQDFEDLCLKLWRPRLVDAKKNGRSGQPQSGVDIFGRDPKTEAWVGIQCKQRGLWSKKVLTVAGIEVEVEQAESFEPPLSHFIVATTAPRDVETQTFVRELSDRRRAEGKFSLDLFAWDDVQDLLHELRQGAAVADSEPEVSIAKLPSTGETFVAREAELARLDAAWADPATNVISFVAMGGAGKSAIVNEWLDGLQADGWRGAERVFGWSFYSQGTEAAGASSEAFTEYALEWLGYDGEVITSPWKKGEVLARLLRERRTLLLLDGLEPLQHPPSAQTGRIKVPAVQALVREVAAQNPGLCVISTRLAVADIAGRAGTVAVDLDRLPPEAGAELLRRLEVEGPEEELRQASAEFDGHSLALSLLGTYLRDVCGGDVRRWREVPLLDEEIEQGGHARRVMESYETWLGEGSELQVLRLMSLFDRPAEAEAVAALRAEPSIAGLTDGFTAGDEAHWQKALARLRKAWLIARSDAGGGTDTHPMVREHFRERLRGAQPEAWRAGHERLYDHYRKSVDELPETLEMMLPLYAAVAHGCQAGQMQGAADVYLRRILRGASHFSWHKLGAFSAELTAITAFFDHPWERPSDQLPDSSQAWILNEAGCVLRALGRLPEAVQPMRAGLETQVSSKEWRNAATQAGNLSELKLTLGEVASAVQTGGESVDLADKTDDVFERMVARTILADALHQAGRCEDSVAAFREAESMQAELRPQYPRLYSVRGYLYCDLLLAMAEPDDGSGLDWVGLKSPRGVGRPEAAARYLGACEEVRVRAEQFFEWHLPSHSVLDIALDHLSLGRAHLGLALARPAGFTEASEHLDRAVDTLRQSGYQWFIPRGFLVRAALRRLRATLSIGDLKADLDAAAADLREAEEIAERSRMRLHEADAHLEWTRLHLHTGDRDAARRHLERASELVAACGYGRRERDVAWLSSILEE